MKNIVTPWLIWGTFAYVLSILLKADELGLLSYLSYIGGFGTWLYYVPIYLVITIFFNRWSDNVFLYASLLITFISLTSMMMLIKYCEVDIPPFLLFLNPFNWCGFYAIGILLQRNIRFFEIKRDIVFYPNFILAFIFSVCLLSSGDIIYWNPISMLFECNMFFLMYIFSCSRTSILLKELGKQSYILYFLHMQLGIAVANAIIDFIEISEYILLFMKPLIVASLTLILVEGIYYILCFLKLEKYSKMLGIVK